MPGILKVLSQCTLSFSLYFINITDGMMMIINNGDDDEDKKKIVIILQIKDTTLLLHNITIC